MEIPGFCLLLQDFCEYCPDFEPEIIKESISSLADRKSCTSIRCVNRKKCAGIAKHIERNLRNDRV